MKKAFITLLLATSVAAVSHAQTTELRMATLIQGDKTSVYYGEQAFVNAYENAEDSLGVIILSSGTFSSPTIKKSISVYGAGFENDPVSGAGKTTVSSIYISPVEKYDENGKKYIAYPNGCHFEGLDLNNIYLESSSSATPEYYGLEVEKCYLNCFYVKARTHNTVIRQCRVGSTSFYNSDKQYNFLVTNSYVSGDVGGYSSMLTSTINVDHCIMSYNSTLNVAYYTNNIIYGRLPANSTGYKNIFIRSDAADASATAPAEENWFGIASNGIFAAEGEDGSYGANKDFALKYPQRYKGTDGTEVGVNGGVYKWNRIPCLPRILSSDIDSRTSTEGKLKVSIKVEAQTAE